MARQITGYGKGWQEPLAVGRLARAQQKMREPTKTDMWNGLVLFPLYAVAAIMAAVSLAYLIHRSLT